MTDAIEQVFTECSPTDLETVTEIVSDDPESVRERLQSRIPDDVQSFTRNRLVRETGQDVVVIHEVLSVLCEEDALTAFIQIRCPNCSTGFGRYYRQSAVPTETEVCFNCGESFEKTASDSWFIRYEL